jgi:large subunit ribosomal protein L35Ae
VTYSTDKLNVEISVSCIGLTRGRRNTYSHTSLLKIDGVNDKAASDFYFGKKVAYIYKTEKATAGSKFRVVWGKVIRGHGTNGVVRAKFTRNLSVSVPPHSNLSFLLQLSPDQTFEIEIDTLFNLKLILIRLLDPSVPIHLLPYSRRPSGLPSEFCFTQAESKW